MDTWTQDPPEPNRLYLFLVPSGMNYEPIELETSATPMRFTGNWEHAAAMGVYRSIRSEDDFATLPDYRELRWPGVLVDATHRPSRMEYFRIAELRLGELIQARATDESAWWALIQELTSEAESAWKKRVISRDLGSRIPSPPALGENGSSRAG